MNRCLPCCNSQNWEYEVFLKIAPKNYEGKTITIEGEGKTYGPEKWAKKAAVQDPSRLGTRFIPPGTYVADSHDKKKFFVVEEINGKYNRDIGFWGDSQGVVAFKASLATAVAAIPIYAIGTMFINMLRIPLNLLGTVKNIFNSTLDAFDEKGVAEAIFTLARRSIIDLTNTLSGGLWSVVRVPFYAVALQVAALYTIFCPYDGRQIVADVERAWHYPCTVDDDISFERNCTLDWGLDTMRNFFNNKVHFLFFCFQPSGSWADDVDEDDSPKYLSLELV